MNTVHLRRIDPACNMHRLRLAIFTRGISSCRRRLAATGRAQEATRIQSFEECNRGSFMDEKLWAGVELKLQNAEFFFEMMGRSLQPPKQTSINVALQASGAIIDTDWQRSFYAYLDAFLSTARSVPEIIQCCFGVDLGHPEMKKWFNTLPADEQDRRHEFKKAFQPALRWLSCAPSRYSATY